MLTSIRATQGIGGDQRGFALPAAILGLVVVGVLITGGIQVALQESRIGEATERAGLAFYVAESGLHSVLGTWNAGASGATVWGDPVTVSGSNVHGDWTSDIRRVGDRLYFIRTRGEVPSREVPANRTVGVLARLATANINPPAALTIQGGVHAQGAPRKVDGSDQIPALWTSEMCPSPLTPMPGVMTDDASEVTASPWPSGAECPNQYVGSPCIQEDVETVQQQMSEMDEMWDELVTLATKTVTGSTVEPFPSYTTDGACNTADPNNWGNPEPSSPDDPCRDYYPVVHVTGNVSMGGSALGQGVLLVEGNLEMHGNAHFSGIILVQGEFSAASGTPKVTGAVSAKSASTLSGTPNIDYSSCAVTRSLELSETLSRLEPLPERSWVDLTGASF